MPSLPKRDLVMQNTENAGSIQEELFAAISIMLTLATSISYAIFKDRIYHKTSQDGNLLAYSRLWSQILAYQTERELR